MKKLIYSLAVFLLLSLACNEKLIVPEVQLSDLSEYHMKIIPENPKSNVEIRLVVFDDCTYNVLSGVKINGMKIDIEKQFNSMMKWPCVINNDTILIGRLQEGTYTVNYKLVDLSTQVTDKNTLIFSFSLPVSK